MAQLFLLLVLVPVIVAPVVLLIGFAGCSFRERNEDPPVINSATGISVDTIRLTWMVDHTATKITFTRVDTATSTQAPPFTVDASPATYDDPGLVADTTYEYTAVFTRYPDGPSHQSAAVDGKTLSPPPTFDAAGAGGAGQTTTGIGPSHDTATASWSHTASAAVQAVVVGLRWTQPGNFTHPEAVRTVKYDGTAMISQGVIGLNTGVLTTNGATYQELFGLLNPPHGAQQVKVSVMRQGQGLESMALTFEANSVSYTETSGFGAVTSDAGGGPGTSLSQTVSAAPNETVVQMFTTASGPITNSNQTVRFDDPANSYVIAEAPGAASVSFTANRDDGVDYAGQALPLLPLI